MCQPCALLLDGHCLVRSRGECTLCPFQTAQDCVHVVTVLSIMIYPALTQSPAIQYNGLKAGPPCFVWAAHSGCGVVHVSLVPPQRHGDLVCACLCDDVHHHSIPCVDVPLSSCSEHILDQGHSLLHREGGPLLHTLVLVANLYTLQTANNTCHHPHLALEGEGLTSPTYQGVGSHPPHLPRGGVSPAPSTKGWGLTSSTYQGVGSHQPHLPRGGVSPAPPTKGWGLISLTHQGVESHQLHSLQKGSHLVVQ